MFHHTGIVSESARRRASLGASPRRASDDDLLADMTLHPHWARSASPPGSDPGHKSPARPASSHSISLPSSSHAPVPSRSECFSIFSYYVLLLYCLPSTAVVYKLCDAGSNVPSFDRDIKSKLKIMLEVNSACGADATRNVAICNGYGHCCALVCCGIARTSFSSQQAPSSNWNRSAYSSFTNGQGSHIT